jgi:uncharacterized protein (UPF0332 family)
MTLYKEEREAIVAHRLQRAKETLVEAVDNGKMKHWHVAANRLYYACFYAVSGLLLQNGLSSRTHGGTIGLFGQHFAAKGIISKEQNKFYQQLFDFREKGDYDDWLEIEEQDVLPLLEPARQFLETIENLISENKSNERLP